MKLATALFLAAAIAVSASSASAQSIVQVDGSSTVYPITEAMAEEFQLAHRTIRVTVGISGTGGGFKKFCRGDTDLTGASRPIKKSEADDCKKVGIEYIELPIALDALAVVVNPRNDWVDHLTVEELKKMWEPEAQGKVMNWNQIRPGFPNRPLRLFGAGVDSGTYDFFTLATVGKEHSSRGDFTASEDDNVLVQGVAGDVNALGFFGLVYYTENNDKLRAVPIKPHKDAKAVAPSVETARDGTYQPLSRPIFIYVNRKSADEKEHVRKFVEFYLDEKNATELVKEVGYVPMTSTAIKAFQQRFARREVGSAFGEGAKIGISIDDLVKERVMY